MGSETIADTSKTELASTSENPYSELSNEALKSKMLNGELKIAKRKDRGKLWNVFGKLVNSADIEIPEVVVCRKCSNIYKYNMRSTSNLIRHKCYVRSLFELEGVVGTTNINVSGEINNQGVVGTPTMVDVEPATEQQAEAVFAKWAVQNCRPFSIAQDAGLMKVAQFFVSVGAKYGKNIDIQQVLPQPTAICGNIDSVYRTQYEKLKCELDLIKNVGYGVTADISTDDYLRKNYLAVTIHYILNGTLFCRLLGVRPMEQDRFSRDLVALTFTKLLNEFNCEFTDNKVTMVTDMVTGTNIDAASFANTNRINCVNHLLHDAMEKSLQEIDDVAELCSTSTNLVQYLKVTATNVKSRQARLKCSCAPTRWNTIFYVFTYILENWSTITIILTRKNQLQRIRQINKSLIRELIKVLEPFDETFKKLEGATYPTIHLTFLLISILKRKCTILDEDSGIAKKLKETLNTYLDLIVIENLSIYHKLAIFLFPPANKLENFSETEQTTIKQKCIELMQYYLAQDTSNTFQAKASGLTTLERELLEGFGQQPSDVITHDDRIGKELETYVNLKVSFLKDTELLAWWEGRKLELPLLYKLSCHILAVPATSAASERAFRAAGGVLSEKRSASDFNDSLMNELLFLHSNLNETEIAYNLNNDS